mmetsp:Transcript_25091/g.51372  ORF Transcript_25091/g.51372 Transcript_25091/m.51372 type:complete len:150 (-) Transcript_25091:544-993(-)
MVLCYKKNFGFNGPYLQLLGKIMDLSVWLVNMMRHFIKTNEMLQKSSNLFKKYKIHECKKLSHCHKLFYPIQVELLLINRAESSHPILTKYSWIIVSMIFVQPSYKFHILFSEIEVKKCPIFIEPFSTTTLIDWKRVALNTPTKHHLRS